MLGHGQGRRRHRRQRGPDDTAAAADTLEGPWEEAAANGMTGQLYFLKGDRMLEVGYVTSSTGRAGAVRLARSAVEAGAATTKPAVGDKMAAEPANEAQSVRSGRSSKDHLSPPGPGGPRPATADRPGDEPCPQEPPCFHFRGWC